MEAKVQAIEIGKVIGQLFEVNSGNQDLVIQIKIDGSIQSSRDLKQVSADISKLKDSAERASKSTQALNMNFDSFSKGLIRTVFQVKNAICFVGLNLVKVYPTLIKPASDMEQFRVKLSALEGSAEKDENDSKNFPILL